MLAALRLLPPGGSIAGGQVLGFGPYQAREDVDLEGDGRAIMMSQKFIAAFEEQLGYITCADIQEHVVFGRNIWQHKNPAGMVRALRRIIHEDAVAEDAISEISR